MEDKSNGRPAGAYVARSDRAETGSKKNDRSVTCLLFRASKAARAAGPMRVSRAGPVLPPYPG